MKNWTDELVENPLRKAEAFYDELLAHHGPGKDRDIHAAAKLLLVALDKFRRHGGQEWMSLVTEYITMIKENPEKFDLMMKCQRGQSELCFPPTAEGVARNKLFLKCGLGIET
jgi:hypothetical protein